MQSRASSLLRLDAAPPRRSRLAGETPVDQSGAGAIASKLAPTASEARRAAEQRLLEGEYAAYTTRLDQLDAEIERRRAELHSTEETLAKLTQTLPMIQARAADYKKLQQENFVSRHGWLEKEQAHIEAERDLAAQQAKNQEIRASLLEGQCVGWVER